MPGQFRYGRLQEAADVCGGRGRLWVLNAVLVLESEELTVTGSDSWQERGWFTRLMSIASARRSQILEDFRHCESE